MDHNNSRRKHQHNTSNLTKKYSKGKLIPALGRVLKKRLSGLIFNLITLSHNKKDNSTENQQREIRRKNYQRKQISIKRHQEKVYNLRLKNYQKRERLQDKQFELREKKYNSLNNKKNTSENKPLPLDVFSVRAGLDMPFLIIVIVLVLIGLIMMFSASYPYAYYFYKDSYKYIKNQALFAIFGIIVMISISYFDYHYLRKFANLILAASYGLLAIVLLLPAINGVHRWIYLGSFSFQPSEIAKFAIILYFSVYISKNFNFMDTFKFGILPFAKVVLPILFLLFKEPHKSCMIIVILITAVLMFVGGVKLRWFAASSLCLVLAGAMSIFMGKYSQNRVSGWGNALNFINKSQWDSTWQTRNSLYAIGSGRLFGLGLGQSRMKHMYLPESYNDFIFSVVCEELGYIGAIIILSLFALLIWRGISIAIQAKDKLGTILGIGIISQIGIQVILNIAVVTDSIPNTGISLPFFSYGGTSLLMLLTQMGILLSISRTSSIQKI